MPVRVGLIGAGYISSWHLEAIRPVAEAEVVAICDTSKTAAETVARTVDGASAYTDLEEMIANANCDAVHVLTPPQSHYTVAKRCLEAGLHVFLEKPFALQSEECAHLTRLAETRNKVVGINHNFLGIPSYVKLKQALKDGTIGPVDAAEINWRFALTPLRSGPFDLWMLRDPANLLFETGPHLFGFVQDLFESFENIQVRVSKPITIPGASHITRPGRYWETLEARMSR